MTLPVSLRLAQRELRNGLSGFRVFLAVLALGVGTIAAVGSLSTSLVDSLRVNARALNGGDVEANLATRPATAGELDYFIAHAERVSAVRELRAMARPAAGDATLVELKAVDDVYPLYGAMKLDPAIDIRTALAPVGGVPGAVVEPEFLQRTGAKVGDRVAVGTTTFVVRATIVEEPDRTASAFSLGPRLMITNAALDTTGLVTLGSLLEHNYRVAIDPAVTPEQWVADLRAAFPDSGWRLRPYTSAQPAVQRFVERFGAFLTLVGLTVLVIGGIGVANGVQNYLATRTETIAILKCLGAPGGLVFRVYLWQIGSLAALGIVIGLVIGALSPLIAPFAIGNSLPVPVTFAIHPIPLGIAALYGVLTALVFTLWPLAQARDIPAARLFRSVIAPARAWPRGAYLVALALASAALLALAVFGSGDPAFSVWFVMAVAGGLLTFRIAAFGVVKLIAVLPRPSAPTVRLALAGLVRPGASTGNVMLSLGAGLSVLVAVAQLDGNINRQVTQEVPAKAPAFFFLDIQPDQALEFDATVRAAVGFEAMERVPTLRGRVTSVNGVSVQELRAQRSHWFYRAELGFSYRATLPDGVMLTAGSWWPPSYTGPAQISLDADVAAETGIALGDTITVDILGRPVSGTVANLRRVEWRGYGLNFSMLFSPGVLEAAPQTHVASATVTPAGEDALFKSVTAKFANVTAIRTREVIERITGLIGDIGTAVRWVSAITIVAGVLVLAGAVAAGRRTRLYDSVILKVLGATRADVLRAYLIEYSILGAATALLATVVGSAGAWAVITFVMDERFVFVVPAVLTAAVGGMLLVVALGIAGTFRLLGQRPAPVLRTA